MRIAHHTRIGGTTGEVFVDKILYHKAAKLFADIKYKVWKSMVNGSSTRVVETIEVTTPGLLFTTSGTCIIPCFHGNAYHFVTFVMQHESRNGTVDTTTH